MRRGLRRSGEPTGRKGEGAQALKRHVGFGGCWAGWGAQRRHTGWVDGWGLRGALGVAGSPENGVEDLSREFFADAHHTWRPELAQLGLAWHFLESA